ncbi:MAG TPA: glycosyltransferase family 2 protein [Pseudonocardiaceae bacterium]
MTTVTPNGHRRLVSIIVPAFNEAGNAAGLVAFFQEIRRTHPELDFELVIVDDGSSDDTAEIMRQSLGAGDVARIASFSRNFGSHAAIAAGLRLARGEAALTISADLQEPMSAITSFLDIWRAGSDVVYGVRAVRADQTAAASRMSRVFSTLFNSMSAEIPTYPKEGPSHILVTRPVIDTINQMPERNRNILAMVAWVGFKQTVFSFEQLPRPAGESKWTTRKKLKLVTDSFVGFSSAPIRLGITSGIVLTLTGAALALGVLLWALFTLSAPSGWGLVGAAVTLFAGLQLGFLGVLGEYLWRAGDDARNRPLYILRGVHDVAAPEAAPFEPAAAAASRS